MKLNRRAFLILIPATAIAAWSWWFFRPPAPSASGGFPFPVTWNGEQATTVNSTNYLLKIDGNVPNPLALTLAELYAMPSVQKTLTIKCKEGWSANVPWEGLPISYLLGQAGLRLGKITNVTIKGITGYTTTLSSDEVADLDYMIALKVDGAPLTVDHGYPARLVAPPRSGLDWVKYVDRITVTSN
jgi:DMSO/TMAO reductase YedYZ molybdopterin-dependent catalytic subunit